jgi:chemotaxis protein CheY-P-specific phosphatase CheC
MTNSSNSVFEMTWQKAFESGFLNASRAFSQLANNQVVYNNFHCGYHDLNSSGLNEDYQHYNKTPRYLITTEIFGDIPGKSYLYLSQTDFDHLTHSIPDINQGTANLRDEFVKELDNILSAAVITKLSNELKCRMFGNVPVLVGKVTSRLEDVIYDDFSEQTEEVYINSINFSFETQSAVDLLFVWVFDKSLISQTELV